MATVTLTPMYIGHSGGAAIYYIDISQSGLANIRSITINDDNSISGGAGNVSGTDIDFVKLSTTLITSASQVTSVMGEEAFDFSGSGVSLWPAP